MLPGLDLLPEVAGLARFSTVGKLRKLGRLDRAGEDAVERVVVVGRDRVELVVVTAGAGDGQAQQPATDDVDPVVDDVFLHVQEPPAERQKSQRRERIGVVLGTEAVGGDLLDHEGVVRLVLVQGADHVVAIGVRVRIAPLFLEDISLRVGVASDIEPVPPPALAVMGRGLQAVNQALIRIRGLVLEEALDLLRSRRQADQVEREPAQEGPLIGGRRRCEPGRFQPRQDERVNRSPNPVPIVHDGRRHRLHGPERPVVTAPSEPGPADRLRDGRRPGGAHLDPCGDRLDRRIAELALGGHLDLGVRLADRLDEQARVRVAGYDRGTALSSFDQRFAGVEPQRSRLLLRAVARQARVDQDRPNLRFEELGLIRWYVRTGSRRSGQNHDHQREDDWSCHLKTLP